MADTEKTGLIDRAFEFALGVHAGQTDKQGVAYIAHCAEVASRVGWADEKAAAVALLHDTIEDGGERVFYRIHELFGTEITADVSTLTRNGDEAYGTYIDRIAATGSETAIRVKLADLAHNLSDRGEWKLAHTTRLKYERAAARLRGILKSIEKRKGG